MNPNISWPDKSLAAEIYCAPALLHCLERAAADGLLAMPRTGLGIGGLLLGRRGSGRIDVTETLPIVCSHARGPSFALTTEEVAAALGEPQPDGDGAAERPEIVGCYWSKPNGKLAVTENDQILFDSLCPEPRQVALMIRPALSSVTMAAFGMRGPENQLSLGIPNELVRRDQTAVAEEDAAEEIPEALIAEPEVHETLPELVPEEPVPVAAPADAPVILPPEVAVYMPPGGTLFGSPVQPGYVLHQKKRMWPTLVLTIAIVVAVTVAAAFFVRGIR